MQPLQIWGIVKSRQRVTPLFPSRPVNCERCVPNWHFSADRIQRFRLSVADKGHAHLMQLEPAGRVYRVG